MDIEKSLKEYKRKAIKLAIEKSAFCGAIIGAAINFIAALILWFFELKILTVILVSVGSGIVSGVISSALFYFLRFKPSTKTVASIVDGCGLEERVITMYEMGKDDSYMARLQREDAKKKLGSVSARQMKLSISLAIVILFAVFFVMSASMTTVSALSSAGIIKSGSEILIPDEKDDSSGEEDSEENLEYVELNYLAGEGGTISGSAYQRIVKGRDATPVVAVPDEGYIFVQWDDGQMNAERWDWSVMSDKTVTAIFQKQEAPGGEEGGDDQDGEQGEGQGGDKGNGDHGESGDGGEGGEGDGSEGEQGDGGEGQGGEGEKGEGQSGQAGQGAEGAKGDGGEFQSMGGQGQGGEPNGDIGEQGEGQSGQGQGGEGEKGDGTGKPDKEGGSGSSGGGNQQGQGGEGGHGNKHDGKGPSSQGEGGGAGQGKPDNNNVMDGGTDYKDAIDYEKEKENLENEDLPPELKDALDNFFEGMKP